jgi:bifunctional non-homologous end joining protein LigD
VPAAFRAVNGVFDAEIICMDKQGRPSFKKVISRLRASGKTNIQTMIKSTPAYCYIFDCLYLDGRATINDTLLRRREWLQDIVKKDSHYRLSETEEDGKALFEAAKEHQLEGIMAKRKDGKYLPGKRSDGWLKIKVRDTVDCVILGFTEGKGNRNATFGALHVAERTQDGIQYRGRVGTGFDDKLMKEIATELKRLKEVKKPVSGKVMEEKTTTWIEPRLVAEISYSMITEDNMFREPVFVRLRPDLFRQ